METSPGKRYRNIRAVKRELQNLEEWMHTRQRVYAGSVFLAVGFLLLLGAQVKRQELLLDAGRLLGFRKDIGLADTADYREARRYFLKEQEGTEKGELYRKILDAIEKAPSKRNWEEAGAAIETLEKSAGTSWEKAGEQIFLANIVQAYESELGFSNQESAEKAQGLLLQAEKNVKENSRETYAPVYRVEIYYQLAVIYGKLDNPVKSIRYYELLLEEKIPVNLEQEARLSIAAMYRQMQEYMEAEKCYERYLSDFPQDAEAYCAYALMEAAERENQKKAESLLSLMEKRGAKKDGFNSKKIKNKIKALETEETE